MRHFEYVNTISFYCGFFSILRTSKALSSGTGRRPLTTLWHNQWLQGDRVAASLQWLSRAAKRGRGHKAVSLMEWTGGKWKAENVDCPESVCSVGDSAQLYPTVLLLTIKHTFVREANTGTANYTMVWYHFGEITLIRVLDSSDHKSQENRGKLSFFLFELIESPDTALIIHARDAVLWAISEKPEPRCMLTNCYYHHKCSHHLSSYVNLIPSTPLHALLSHNSNCIWPFDSSVENALWSKA